jgi:hypothetical protein
MTGLKLGKLPDRTPIKVSISLSSDLHERLRHYAALYLETYGCEEPLTELIPAMLAAFLDIDRSSSRSRPGAK